jgi:hypothetical protein
MDLARGENAVRVRITRVLLNGQEQLRRRVVKLAFEEMSFADQAQRRTRSLARRSAVSACSIARSCWPAQSLRTPLKNQPREKLGVSVRARFDQRHHRADILAEIGQNKGCVARMPGSSPATWSARRAERRPRCCK